VISDSGPIPTRFLSVAAAVVASALARLIAERFLLPYAAPRDELHDRQAGTRFVIA
jgi:hypothetical protein